MAQEFTQANRTFFNEFAASYDTKPWQQEISASMLNLIRSNLDFIGVDWVKEGDPSGREVRLLDYACGTGLATRALKPYVTQTLGIDISPAMVDRYNALARSSAIPPTTAFAIVGDLLSDDPASLPQPSLKDGITEAALHDFDIAAITVGFHHFHDPSLALSRIAERLRPGGVLLILDWAREDDEEKEWNEGRPFKAQHTVKTHGFSEKRMRGLFEGAGLGEVGWRLADSPFVLRMNEDNPVEVMGFLGRARKP